MLEITAAARVAVAHEKTAHAGGQRIAQDQYRRFPKPIQLAQIDPLCRLVMTQRRIRPLKSSESSPNFFFYRTFSKSFIPISLSAEPQAGRRPLARRHSTP